MATRPAVTVYTTGPACQSCVATKRHLDRRGIRFTEIRIDKDEVIAKVVRHLGFHTAPVVSAPGQVWGGYRPDLIDALTTADS